ncbi:hypothetical protein ACNKHT_12225 [Shigella flexneri]
MVWKAIPSITLIMSPIFCELVAISCVVSHGTDLNTARLRRCRGIFCQFRRLSCVMAFCPTVAVNCSILAAVCASDAACCSVRLERSLLPATISAIPMCISWLPLPHHLPSHAKPAAWSSDWQKWR